MGRGGCGCCSYDVSSRHEPKGRQATPAPKSAGDRPPGWSESLAPGSADRPPTDEASKHAQRQPACSPAARRCPARKDRGLAGGGSGLSYEAALTGRVGSRWGGVQGRSVRLRHRTWRFGVGIYQTQPFHANVRNLGLGDGQELMIK